MSKFRAPAKWKADGPSRTNTGSSIRGRIGPPIPIPDDDEFPIRAPGTGIATPVGTEGQDDPPRLRGSTATDLGHTNGAMPELSNPKRSSTIPIRPSREDSFRGRNPPPAARNSMASGVTALSTSGKGERKKSSLRSVFGRLFGKKRKSGSATSNEKEQSPRSLRTDQHRSDPTALSMPPKDTADSQKRSASLPINEYNRALRSHSIILEDFPLADSQDTNRSSVQTDGFSRPRRATTPSRLWTPNKTPGYVDWTGLSPRPASTYVRGSKVISDEEAEAAIGMAVTSGSHPNRRSRSLGELRGITSGAPIARRRSDEIRYWRESYDPGIMSPMSSTKAETEEPILQDEAGNVLVDAQEPPQPFNFGPMGEMAGMKITQAASLETRVQRIEVRLQKTEKVVTRLHHNRDAVQLQDPPRRNLSSLNGSFTRPATDNSEISLPKHGNQHRPTSYSRPSTVDTNASYPRSVENFPPPDLPTPDTALSVSQHKARPLSTSTTIRGIPSSSPTIPKDGNLTGEHYAALTNMILAERAARQQLEIVVHNLQQELQSLRSFSRPGTRSNHLRNTSGGGAFSTFEHDDSDDDNGRYDTEVFQTPIGEREAFGDDTFGGVMSDDGKSATRTMSLSQMTLAKGTNMQHV